MPSNDNIVYEINRLVNDKSILRSDMNDAAGLVMEMFKKKYINRLSDKIAEHKQSLRKNPPKEIQLINVLRQFMPESERQAADKAIEAFIMADTLARLRMETVSGTGEPSVASADPDVRKDSIHEDGVYDIDENCLKKKNISEAAGMMIMAAMLMR